MWELYMCSLATAVQLHVKWSCKHKLNYKRRKGWCFCWTVSERSLWNDSTRHVWPIRNFRIGTSLSNRIRIGTSDLNSNRISKLRRSLISNVSVCLIFTELLRLQTVACSHTTAVWYNDNLDCVWGQCQKNVYGDRGPCGLCGYKNRPTPFPGRIL